MASPITIVDMNLVKKMCQAEGIAFSKCKKIISWLENQVRFLRERSGWEARGVIGGLRKQFGGELPDCEESDKLREQIVAVQGESEMKRDDARYHTAEQARRQNGPRSRAAPRSQPQPQFQVVDGFIVMQVPLEMVSAVLTNGGTIVATPQQTPAPSRPRRVIKPKPMRKTTKPAQKPNGANKAPRVNTKNMTPEERRAHAASLTNPTTIYLPDATDYTDSDKESIALVESQLRSKGIRVSNSERNYKYACANKHRNTEVYVNYDVQEDTILYNVLTRQGVRLNGPIEEEETADDTPEAAAGAGAGEDSMEEERGLGGGVTPPFGGEDEEDDGEDDDIGEFNAEDYE
jgi:hypothetical protein